ncbi:right-handed parallel beta-helix repeat-containing protein [Palaeococcus ferrophilus]|uniref:right-handed parallel beta-helix repeat-containing protein n=1 Tax=Palaeococcus ferrophilus TaxID=83868 RepID=UPI00064E9712|nr:right-handed parallel beta-helix repeat-containing protein [Palaeococcus ferrophilus]
MRKATIMLVYLLLASYLNVGFVGFAPVSAGGNVVFSDDFNDNSLDTSKWTEDVVGGGNSYTEANGEAEFVVFGHYGWDSGHALLRSRSIHLNNWSSITLSGRWKFTDPGTAEMLVRVEDLNSSNFVGVHYVSWPSEQVSYRYYSNSVTEDRTIPRDYVPFKVVIYKDRFEYWEGGALVKTIYTTSMASVTDFQVVIGGWDYSAYYSHMYFDDIAVEYTPGTPPENPLSITIVSPEEGIYNTTTIDLNVTANKPVDEWHYSLNGGKNVTFTPNTTITAQEGDNSLKVYALAGDESAMAQVSFYVNLTKDTTPPGTVKNLTHEVGSDYILWTWENPDDKDFDEALVYIDGTFEGGTANGEWLLDGLSPGETHTIGILTNDTSGNVNTTWVNDTATTLVPSETVYVKESGWWYEGGAFNPSETPLGDGIDACVPGGTVVVLPGTYGESVEVYTPLTIEGHGAVITGDGSEWDIGMKPVVYVGSDNVTVRDLTVVTSISNIGIWLDGVWNSIVEGSNITVTEPGEDVRYGIYLSYGGGNTVRNNKVSVSGFQGVGIYVYEEEGRSDVYNNTVTITGDSADGILVFYTSADVHGNSVQISGVGGTPGYALYLYGAGDSSVDDNDVVTSLNEANAWAIGVIGEFSGTLSGNTVNDLPVDIVCPGDCMIRSIEESERPTPPEGYSDIDEFLEASADSWLYLTFHYGDSALEGLNEDSLGIWRFSEGWTLDGVSDQSLDTAGNTVGANLTQFSIFAPLARFQMDTTPPVLTFVPPTPANGSLLGNPAVTINVTASENLTSALLEFDGVNHTMGGSGREWSYTLSVPDGPHSFRVYGQDLAGNNGTSEERSFEVDTKAPTYSNAGQDREGIPPGGTVNIHALWSDPHLSEAVLYTNITGSWDAFDEVFFEGTYGWSNFSISMDEPGSYCWYIKGIDELEHSNETPVYCFEVYSPPEIVSYSPESPVESYVGEPVTFTVTANQVVNVTWYVGEGEVKREENVETSSYTNSTAGEGEYSVYAVVENANGSDSVSWVWYVYPRPGVVISFVDPTPKEGAMLSVRSVTINVTSSVDLDNATLEWNGVNESMSGSGMSWWLNKGNLSDGSYIFRVYGSADGIVNWTEERRIEVDATPPELLESGQSADLLRIGENIALFAEWSDPHLDTVVLWSNTTPGDGGFVWDSRPLEVVDGWSNWTVSITEDMAGKTFCWHMVANDTFGNEEQSDELCFSVEERLEITSFSPEAEEVTYPPSGSAAFSIELNQIANVTWSINGTEVLSGEGDSSTYTNSTLLVGLWNVSVTASNENGEVSHWWLMRVEEADTTPPALWFVKPTPSNGSFINSGEVTFRLLSNESLSSAVLVLDGDNHPMTGGGTEWTLELSLPKGVHIFHAEAVDMSGNANETEERSFTVDLTPPSLSFVPPTPENGSLLGAHVYKFAVNASENLTSAVLELDGVNVTLFGSGMHWESGWMYTLNDGSHRFRVYGTDRAGNLGISELCVFEVDTTMPSVNQDLVNLTVTSSMGDVIHAKAERKSAAGVILNVTDAHPGIYTVDFNPDANTPQEGWYRLETGSYESGEPFFIPFNTSEEEYVVYHIHVADAAGNIGYEKYIYLTVEDTTPPGGMGYFDLSTYVGGAIVSWINPNDEDFDHTELWVNESLVGNFTGEPGSSMEQAVSLTPGGTYNISVVPVDRYGNRGVPMWRVVTIPYPDLGKASYVPPTPENGSELSSNITYVTVKVSSDERMAACTMVWDGASYGIPATTEWVTYIDERGKMHSKLVYTCVKSFSGHLNGEHYFYALVYDGYGNSRTLEVRHINVQWPCFEDCRLEVTSPGDGSNVMSLLVPINFTMVGNALPEGYTLTIEGLEYKENFLPNISYTWVGDELKVNGSYVFDMRPLIEKLGKLLESGEPLGLTITAEGRCGGKVTGETAFTLCKGNRPPEMKVDLHTHYRPGESVVPGIKVEDPDGNLEGLYISINGGPYVSYTAGTDISENLTRYATNAVAIKAADLCGAETVETLKVEVSGPPVRGDWVVNESQACYGREYTVNGSILITENGSLTLRNCKAHVLGKGMDVNGTFRVLGGSLVDGPSLSLTGRGGTLDVEYSTLRGFENGEFTGTVSALNSHLIGNFAFPFSEVILDGSEIEGGATVSGSLTVKDSTFHSGAGLRYLRNGLPGENLSVVNSTFVDGDRGIEVVGDLSDWHWTLRDLEIENNRGCGLHFEDPSYSYATQTVKGAVVRNNGKGVCIKNARLRFENSVVESNDEANFDLDLGTNWLYVVGSNVTGSRYAFLARNTGGIEMWDTNVSGSVSPYPGYFIVHVSGGKKAGFKNGDAGNFYAYVDGELLVKSYHLQDGKITVHPGGTLRVEDTDGIPATNPLDRDASVLRKMTVKGEAGSEESTLILLNSKLEDTTVESYSKEVLVRGCHIEGGSLAFNTNFFWNPEDTETLSEVIGEDSEWFYSTSMPAEDWVYTTSTAGMEASDEPFYADSYSSHFTGGTEVGEFTDLYLKKVVTLDTLPAQAWLNYYAISGVEVYINGRKVVDELDHRAQLSYAYGWGGAIITAHPLMDVIDVGGYLRRGENVIAVHVRSPDSYPYLQLGAFKATLHVVEGMAGLTDSVVKAPVTGVAARLIVARDEVDSNITLSYYSRVRISDSTLRGGIGAEGSLELLRSELIGSGRGRGINAGQVFNVLVNESTVRGFSQGIYAHPGRRGTSTLGIYSSRISGNGVGVYARGINMTVRSSYIMHNGEGIDLSYVGGRVKDSLISDNGVGILVHPYVGGGLLVDHDTVVGNDVGLSVKDGNGESVVVTNSIIQNNDLGLLVNGSASIITMNNSIVNTRGVHIVRNSAYTVLKRTDWGGHEPLLVKNYTGGTMYTADGEESENYDILVDEGTLTLVDTVETGSGWGSSLLGAFLSVYPMDGDEVKGVVTLAGSASSRSGIAKVNYTLVWNGTEELIEEATPNSYEYHDYVTFDSLARNLTGLGYLKFTAKASDGTSVSAVRRVYFGNAHIDIVSVFVNHPRAVYAYRRYHEGDRDTSMPYDERFANVTVTLRNTGSLMGVAKVELVLPEYIERHTGRVNLLVAVPGGMSGEFHALIPITAYDPITLKWDPLPDELPSDHGIPMEVRLYDLDGIVRDEVSREIGFDLGPVFRIESYSAYPYTRQWCQNEPDKCHVKEFSDGTTYTYDGDGDGDLEAAESHHFDLDIRNVGDMTAYIKLVNVRDQIPERDPNAHYKFLRMMSVPIEEESSVYTLDVESANLTGLAPPGKLKWIYGAWMPWWHDDPPKWIPPVNFSGDYMTSVAVNYVPYENGQPSDWVYTTYSINYEKTPVKALNKTFVPFSESLGPVQIDVLGINGNKTYMRLRNTDENIYYSYYVEGAYDMNPEGYVWYHVIPPGFEFKAIADQSKEPGTVIPHYRVNAGVDYSLLFNELQLAAIATEGALKVYDIDVPVETIVMAIAKSGLKIGNIVENIDFPNNQTIEEYSQSSSAVQVNAMLSADNTTIVPLTLNDFVRWEDDYGMDQGYYYNLTHLSEIPLDAKVNVLTTLAKAIVTDEELQTVFIETVLEVVDNDVLNEVYKNVQEMKEPPDPGDEVEENLNDMKDDINAMLVEYLKEEIKKQKSFQELDPKEQKKALKKSGKSIAAAIETFEKMGEWAFYNIYAVMTKPSPMQIQVLDPPANYTVEAEKMDRVVLLGGEAGNLDGWGNVSLTFGNPDVYRAEYIVPTLATKVGPLFNGTLESMRVEVDGRREGQMLGEVRMEIRPDARNASVVFALFRNDAFAKAFAGAYMTRIESFNVSIENNTLFLSAEGELASLPEDKEVHITLNVGRILTNATIVRKGHYRVVELKPAFGIDPSKVETSFGGNATLSEGTAGNGTIIVASPGNGTVEPPEIVVNPTELYAGGTVGIATSEPCLVNWTLGELTGEGALVTTEGLKPGNYTLSVTCTYGNLTENKEFPIGLLKRPTVERKADGASISSEGSEWVRVITGTDIYRIYFIPNGPINGTVAVYQLPGRAEAPKGYAYVTYALFNVTHPESWSLRNVTLRFRVSKEWMSENNVSADGVLLLRWEGKWVEYRPKFEYEDLRYAYYRVKVPGLSLFAVAEKVGVPTPPSPGTNETTETETTTTPSPTETPSSSPLPPSTEGGSNLPYYALGIAVLILIGLYLYRRR